MTPAIRALEAAGVAHTLHQYQPDPKADSYGLDAAEKLGLDARRVFKTLVAKAEGKLLLTVIPVANRLDLKKLAALVGSKKAEMAEPSAAERATGYVVGGISPLGARRKLPTWIDASIREHQSVFCSAGQRGLQMELAPDDLIRLTEGRVAGLIVQG